MIDPEQLANRVRKNGRHLAKWAAREGIEAYRLYDRDMPEFPLIIDRYADWLHVQVLDRRRPLEDAEITRIREQLAPALEVPPGQLMIKQRRRQRGTAQYEKLDPRSRSFTVRERDLRFEVNLGRYLDTGLFIDHRNTRQMVRDQSRDRRLLNLFAYTGSFSVYAAAGGASHTVTVDLSKTYQDWGRRNLVHNGLADRDRHEFIQADALQFIDDGGSRRQRRFDLIVLDPPSFSNSKRMHKTFDVQRDQLDLLRNTLRLLAPGGTLYFSNNRQGFRLDDAVSELAEVEEISAKTIPQDCRRHRPHRCWRLTR